MAHGIRWLCTAFRQFQLCVIVFLTCTHATVLFDNILHSKRRNTPFSLEFVFFFILLLLLCSIVIVQFLFKCLRIIASAISLNLLGLWSKLGWGMSVTVCVCVPIIIPFSLINISVVRLLFCLCACLHFFPFVCFNSKFHCNRFVYNLFGGLFFFLYYFCEMEAVQRFGCVKHDNALQWRQEANNSNSEAMKKMFVYPQNGVKEAMYEPRRWLKNYGWCGHISVNSAHQRKPVGKYNSIDDNKKQQNAVSIVVLVRYEQTHKRPPSRFPPRLLCNCTERRLQLAWWWCPSLYMHLIEPNILAIRDWNHKETAANAPCSHLFHLIVMPDNQCLIVDSPIGHNRCACASVHGPLQILCSRATAQSRTCNRNLICAAIFRCLSDINLNDCEEN